MSPSRHNLVDPEAFRQFQYPTSPLSVLPELQRDAAAAIAALVLKGARTGKPVPQI
jgi:hypothetical protein